MCDSLGSLGQYFGQLIVMLDEQLSRATPTVSAAAAHSPQQEEQRVMWDDDTFGSSRSGGSSNSELGPRVRARNVHDGALRALLRSIIAWYYEDTSRCTGYRARLTRWRSSPFLSGIFSNAKEFHYY